MAEKLVVGLEERSYPIFIGEGILGDVGGALREVSFARKVAVVTNQTVGGFYADRVMESLSRAGFEAFVINIPDGEQFKNLATLETIYDALIQRGFDRFSGLVALGGGVIGDITGFAAATFLRGIPFAQVPTTLLAQVDSSVGGKTGVNHPLGKNLIGAFYQPRLVYIDVSTLVTLPEREFASGLAEVIKYGIIRDRDFFDWLKKVSRDLEHLAPAALIQAVKRSCQIKANVVEIDEREGSLRAILNYGHTFGHAVETLAGYGKYSHGEAVAIGMAVAAAVSNHLHLCTQENVEEIRNLLAVFDLPTLPPAFSLQDYLEAMGRDKKAREGVLRLVLNRGIGDCLVQEIGNPEQVFSETLNALLKK
jgi:3-dehydroquinate synthase